MNNELNVKVQQVVATIQQLKIDATYENMNYLMGCIFSLKQISDGIAELENQIVKLEGQVKAMEEHAKKSETSSETDEH